MDSAVNPGEVTLRGECGTVPLGVCNRQEAEGVKWGREAVPHRKEVPKSCPAL